MAQQPTPPDGTTVEKVRAALLLFAQSNTMFIAEALWAMEKNRDTIKREIIDRKIGGYEKFLPMQAANDECIKAVRFVSHIATQGSTDLRRVLAEYSVDIDLKLP